MGDRGKGLLGGGKRTPRGAVEPPRLEPASVEIGRELGALRRQYGLPLGEIARILRIRIEFLEAIEDGATERLPGIVYALGYVRAYGDFLGLDGETLVRRYKSETGDPRPRSPLVLPEPEPERHIPAGAIVITTLFLLGGAYAGWYYLSATDQTIADIVPGLAPDNGGAAPPPAPNAEPGAAYATDAAGPPLPALQRNDAFTQTAGAPVVLPPAPEIPETGAQPVVVAAKPVAAPAVPSGPPQLSLQATAASWVQLRDPEGRIVMERVMQAGENYAVPTGGDFVMDTGNAGGLLLLLDGQPMPPLGGNGEVVRKISLSPQAVADRAATVE